MDIKRLYTETIEKNENNQLIYIHDMWKEINDKETFDQVYNKGHKAHHNPIDCNNSVIRLNRAGFDTVVANKSTAFLAISKEVVDDEGVMFFCIGPNDTWDHNQSSEMHVPKVKWDCASHCVEFEEKLLAGKYDKKIRAIGKNAAKELKGNKKFLTELGKNYCSAMTDLTQCINKTRNELNRVMGSNMPRKEGIIEELTHTIDQIQQEKQPETKRWYEDRIEQTKEKIKYLEDLLNHQLIKLYLKKRSPKEAVRNLLYSSSSANEIQPVNNETQPVIHETQPVIHEKPQETKKLTAVNTDITKQNNQAVTPESQKKTTLNAGQIALISDIVKQAVEKEINAQQNIK